MVLERVDHSHRPHFSSRRPFQRNIPLAQEVIYGYLLDIVKNWPPEEVLEEFKRLYIHHVNTFSSHILPALYEIVFSNHHAEFRNTLKRSCYILINNWELRRDHKHTQELIQLFDDPILHRPTVSPTLRRLRSWVSEFVESEDFQQIRLFTTRHEERKTHWTERYVSYLLVPQYADLRNPVEQRHAARALSRQLKEQFKFELAMYTAKSQTHVPVECLPKNPTALGDDVLRLVKSIVARRGMFSYGNLANIFVQQTQNLSYLEFKQCLKRYLIFSSGDQGHVETLRQQLWEQVDALYMDYHGQPISDALLLRTCNRIIEALTFTSVEGGKEPSPLFLQAVSQGNPLTIAVLLLKLVLICRYSRTHLEARIAEIIQYYKDYPEEQCSWVIYFLEIFDITMAIYAENIEFNLVNMQGEGHPSLFQVDPRMLDAYRIFSQLRRVHSPDTEEVVELALLNDPPSELPPAPSLLE